MFHLSKITDFDDFAKVHAILLAASGIPPAFHRQLFRKLSSEIFDGGNFFSIEQCEGGRQRRLLLSAQFLPVESDIFLIDHAWTFRLSDALKQLKEVPGLAERMAALMCVDLDLESNSIGVRVVESEKKQENGIVKDVLEILEREMERGSHSATWLELEELGINDDMLSSFDLPTRFPAFSPVVFPSLSHINLKGNHLDGVALDDLLHLLRGFTCLQELEVDIPGPLGNSAVWILESFPGLSSLNGITASSILDSGKFVVDSALKPRLPDLTSAQTLVERVIGAMWLYLMTYRLADEEKIDETSVWYAMDELGSALRHSDNANFRVTPFLFMPEGKLESAMSYSVLWPTRDVNYGDECTRDFLFGIGEEKQRSARLTAWFHTPESYFTQEFKNYKHQLESKSLCPTNKVPPITNGIHSNNGHPLYVYTDIPQVEEFLSRPEFVLTTDPKDADIIWASMQVDEEVRKAVGITDNQYINQFPFEACLVMKHHLAETIHEAHGFSKWLQPTYNLETHLSQLIGDYLTRKRAGLDNLWILKPWNMARTIDTTVTDDISAIIRLMETGPKICQKYIERPALFKGRKFDLRYIVLARSMKPVEIFLADVFWVRLANNQFTLEKSSLFEYETHFTVMNYIGRLNHMNTPEFVQEFEEEHQVKWLDIHQSIRNMIRSVFDSAAIVHPEMHSPFSRAMYGVDVMLDCWFMPKILEVTYCPDCSRACKYDTEAIVGGRKVMKGHDFFNIVFGCLFLDEMNHVSPL